MNIRLTKKAGYTDTTLRTVYNEDKSERFGVVGTVEDLIKVKIFTYCDYNHSSWCFIPLDNPESGYFGETRDEALKGIKAVLTSR